MMAATPKNINTDEAGSGVTIDGPAPVTVTEVKSLSTELLPA